MIIRHYKRLWGLFIDLQVIRTPALVGIRPQGFVVRFCTSRATLNLLDCTDKYEQKPVPIQHIYPISSGVENCSTSHWYILNWNISMCSLILEQTQFRLPTYTVCESCGGSPWSPASVYHVYLSLNLNYRSSSIEKKDRERSARSFFFNCIKVATHWSLETNNNLKFTTV